MLARLCSFALLAAGCGHFRFDKQQPDAATSSDALTCPPCAQHGNTPGIAVAAGTSCYCIDATEVTEADYLLFLGGTAPAPPPECAWKTTNVPNNAGAAPWPPADDELDRPVADVDWCDAWAYCTWAGERLCGAIAGGAIDPTAVPDAATDQWYRACSNGGALAFPYGNTFDPSACVSGLALTQSVANVGSTPTCEGGLPGLFDMSGNVNEWLDGCDGATGMTDNCGDAGGGKYYSDAAELGCTSRETRLRDDRNTDVGFRCCSP